MKHIQYTERKVRQTYTKHYNVRLQIIWHWAPIGAIVCVKLKYHKALNDEFNKCEPLIGLRFLSVKW